MSELINSEVFKFLLILTRVCAALFLLPVFDSGIIFQRLKIIIAISISLVLYPVIVNYIPSYSSSWSKNFELIVTEMLVGVLIAIGVKFCFLSLNMVGQVISMQSGLSAATLFDPTQNTQNVVFVTLINFMAIVFIVITDTHHLFIKSIAESYINIDIATLLNTGDISNFISRLIADTFIIAFKLSSPFIIVSVVMLVGSGILSRLMPNLQIFFLITPIQILVMFVLMYILIDSMFAKILELIHNNLL